MCIYIYVYTHIYIYTHVYTYINIYTDYDMIGSDMTRCNVSTRSEYSTIKRPPEYCQDGTVTHLNHNRLL